MSIKEQRGLSFIGWPELSGGWLKRRDMSKQTALGLACLHTAGGDRYEEGIRYLQEAAKDDVLAACYLSFERPLDLSLQEHDSEAATMLQQMRDGYSMYYLGLMYKNGRGVNQDYAQALALFREAVCRGVAAALCELGVMCIHGLEVPKNPEEGIRLLQQACDAGVIHANFTLGVLFLNGLGVMGDLEKARDLLQVAAAKGHPGAMSNLGVILASGKKPLKNPEEAVSLFRRAIHGDSPCAMVNLGIMYFKGEGVPRSYETAFELFRQGAERGVPEAFLQLGYMCQNGLGVTQSSSDAQQWYQRALVDKIIVPKELDHNKTPCEGSAVRKFFCECVSSIRSVGKKIISEGSAGEETPLLL